MLIYRQTETLRAAQGLLGHSQIEITVRYLGIEVNDAIELPRRSISERLAQYIRFRTSSAALGVSPIICRSMSLYGI